MPQPLSLPAKQTFLVVDDSVLSGTLSSLQQATATL
jgi:hypothetical protein